MPLFIDPSKTQRWAQPGANVRSGGFLARRRSLAHAGACATPDGSRESRPLMTEEQGREAVVQMTGVGLPPIVEHNARSTGTDLAGYLTESPWFSTFVRDDDTV